jgi:hypothetical protein
VSSNRTNTVDFIGQHPPEVVDVKQGDFVYFFDSNGTATLGRC